MLSNKTVKRWALYSAHAFILKPFISCRKFGIVITKKMTLVVPYKKAKWSFR